MSDPIDRLSGFASSFEGEIMPRTAAEARRRGDAIRRRRHALVAAGSALAVVAVAVPVFAFANGDSGSADRTPVATNAPSTHAASTRLGFGDLLAADETVAYGGAGSFVERTTYRGDGQDVFHPCATASMAGLGATDVVRRDFDLHSPGQSPPGWLTEVAGEFPTEQRAETAYSRLLTDLACPDGVPSGTDYQLVDQGDVSVPAGSAHQIIATWVAAGTRGYVELTETGIVRTGSRVAVVTSVIGAQDYPDLEHSTMREMLPTAAERLLPDSSGTATVPPPTAESSSPPQGGPAVTTAIPDDIPIDLDLVDMGSDGDYQEPEHLQPSDFEPVTLCGTDVWPPAHADALSAWATGPEYSDRRDLLTFNSVDDAVAAVQSIRDTLQGCTRSNGQVVTTQPSITGYDSVTFSTSCPAGGPPCLTMYQATRVGNAVLLTSIYGEGSLDDAKRTVLDRTDITRNIAPHLCVFTADGCRG